MYHNFHDFLYNNPSNVMQCSLFFSISRAKWRPGLVLYPSPSSNNMLNMMHAGSSLIPHTQESQMANHIMIDRPFVHRFDSINQILPMLVKLQMGSHYGFCWPSNFIWSMRAKIRETIFASLPHMQIKKWLSSYLSIFECSMNGCIEL